MACHACGWPGDSDAHTPDCWMAYLHGRHRAEAQAILAAYADRHAALAGALGNVAAWLLSYSDDSEIARRWPGVYQDMLWHGYRAACVVLEREAAGYAAWRGWFTDTVRQTYLDDLLARHSDEARQALAGEP